MPWKSAKAIGAGAPEQAEGGGGADRRLGGGVEEWHDDLAQTRGGVDQPGVVDEPHRILVGTNSSAPCPPTMGRGRD